MRRLITLMTTAIGAATVILITAVLTENCAGQVALPAGLNERLTELKRENKYDEALKVVKQYQNTSESDKQTGFYFELKLTEADLYRAKGMTGQALCLLDSAGQSMVNQFNENDPLLAEFHKLRGTIHLIRGNLQLGHEEIKEAIKIYAYNVGDKDTLLAPCYNKLGNYYYFRKDYDSAMFYYTKALELCMNKTNNLEDKASYIQNIGIIYLELNNYSKAEEHFLESLTYKEKLYTSDNFSLGRLYMNLGRFYEGISAIDKAFFYLEKAEKIYSNNNGCSHIELGKIYWNKGLIYHLSGDSEAALSYLFNAKQIIDSVFTDNQALIASLNSDIANVYNNIGQNKNAINYYNSALKGADDPLRKKTLRNLGRLYTLENNFARADYYFNQLMKESKKTINEKNPDNALTYLNYGFYMLESGNDSAIIFLNEALEMFKMNTGYHNREIAAALYMIGDYYCSKDQTSEALRFYQKSLIAISNNFADTVVEANPALEMLPPDIRAINAISKKAACLRKLYVMNHNLNDLYSAINSYKLCFDLVDQVRLNLKAENSQIYLQDGIDDIYNQAISSCFTAHEFTKDPQWLRLAFNFSERGKSMVLLSELKDANAKKISLVPSELTKIEKEIKSNIELYRNNIWQEENSSFPDEKKIRYFQTNLLKFEKSYDSLADNLERSFPLYYKYKYDPSVAGIKDLQRIMSKNEVLLEYTLTEDYVYLFIVSPKVFDALMIPFDSVLIKDIFKLRDNLDFDHVFDYNMENYMEFQTLSYLLYTKLILPVQDYLPEKKLIIIPDKELNLLSFESLIQNVVPSDSISFRNLPYLIKTCPISYAPSSTIFSLIKNHEVPEIKEGVLALAPSPYLLTRGMIANNKILTQLLQNDLELPGATWEAEAILKIMKGKKLVGEVATEAEFKKLSSSYDILHFATHTQIDNENPLSSMLAFYPSGGNGEDGVLHTYEIYNLNLKGELAVLSACSTGNGKLMKGEGVMSLARAFTYAGIPSVVMTLWDVDDISTGNIVPYFYQLLNNGYDKDVSLQRSKLKYLELTKPEIETHPAFWSGFVLYGNNRGFKQKSNFMLIIILLCLGVLIILISVILIRKYYRYNKQLSAVSLDLSSELHPEDRF